MFEAAELARVDNCFLKLAVRLRQEVRWKLVRGVESRRKLTEKGGSEYICTGGNGSLEERLMKLRKVDGGAKGTEEVRREKKLGSHATNRKAFLKCKRKDGEDKYLQRWVQRFGGYFH